MTWLYPQYLWMAAGEGTFFPLVRRARAACCGQHHRCGCSSKHFLRLPLGPILNNGFQTMTPPHFPPLIIQKIGPEDLRQSSREMCQTQGCVQTPIIGSPWDPRERVSGLQDSSPKLPHLFPPLPCTLLPTSFSFLYFFFKFTVYAKHFG